MQKGNRVLLRYLDIRYLQAPGILAVQFRVWGEGWGLGYRV